MRLNPAHHSLTGLTFISLIFFAFASAQPGGQQGFPILKGPYFGQTAPGMKPEPFVTYDGEYLFFIRNTGPKADLKPFWVDSSVIDRYR